MIPKDPDILALFNQVMDSVQAPKPKEGCTATYPHYAHDDCPGIGPSREEYEKQDFDDVEYLQFYHETVIFDDEVYRIEVGSGGIAKIRADTNLITHDDGRTQEIPWPCVSEWNHISTVS